MQSVVTEGSRFGRSPFSDVAERARAGRFGMGLFLASLAMLFGATLIAFLVLRLQIGKSWPQLPPLPDILWLSSAVIVISSATMQAGVWAIERNRPRLLSLWLLATLILGCAFLVMQSIAWLSWMPAAIERWEFSSEWRFALTAFYVFTLLHALHVIGGVIPMTVVLRRSISAVYTPGHCTGVRLCAMYWHFLDVVWLCLFATMLIGV